MNNQCKLSPNESYSYYEVPIKPQKYKPYYNVSQGRSDDKNPGKISNCIKIDLSNHESLLYRRKGIFNENTLDFVEIDKNSTKSVKNIDFIKL